jgi:hypothetical protein
MKYFSKSAWSASSCCCLCLCRRNCTLVVPRCAPPSLVCTWMPQFFAMVRPHVQGEVYRVTSFGASSACCMTPSVVEGRCLGAQPGTGAWPWRPWSRSACTQPSRGPPDSPDSFSLSFAISLVRHRTNGHIAFFLLPCVRSLRKWHHAHTWGICSSKET